MTTDPGTTFRGRKSVLLGAALAGLLLLGVAILIVVSAGPRKPLASIPLADGRIIQIEGLTFGREHRMGQSTFVVDHFGYWLPQKLRWRIWPSRPEARLNLDEPGLVVWLDAVDAATGRQVDCQGLHLEFVDVQGDLFAPKSSSCFGGGDFWREGHLFYAFPRNSRKLTLQITPWTTNVTSRGEFANPYFSPPAHWVGKPLPQATNCGNIEIALTSLQVRTNSKWESAVPYLEPQWELRRDGKTVSGWSEPEWTAQDPNGNHGQYVGVHQTVLRFTAVVYPAATNREAAMLIAALPSIALTNFTTNIVWWNTKAETPLGEIEALGFFPKGTYAFHEGQCVTNPPAGFRSGPVRGGAPSGWTGTSRRVSPVRVEYWSTHYTTRDPVIYLRAPDSDSTNRLAIRLRDDQGRDWVAKPESQGNPQGIHAFLVELPADVKTVAGEIVLLKPVRADFLVDTKTGKVASR